MVEFTRPRCYAEATERLCDLIDLLIRHRRWRAGLGLLKLGPVVPLGDEIRRAVGIHFKAI
jgi:hypothetical protein